ncbi:MAG: zinc ribbon domain-containing protein [Nocardioides sp.]
MQAVDSRAAQAQYSRDHLPEHAELVELRRRRAELNDQVRDARIVVDDLTAAQAKADQDVEQVKARKTRDQERIDKGNVGSPKDLEHMMHEIESLQRRIGVLEDEELEIMERLEEAQAGLTSLEAALTAIDERGRAVLAARDEKTAAFEAEAAECTSRRTGLIEPLPADLLALYDRLREQRQGVGAAELKRKQCLGCMLTLDNLELAKIKALPEDEVARCEECQRILVRTGESGL